MIELLSILFSLPVIALGFVIFNGAQRKWIWLIDPPNYLWPFYTQALIKVIFGKKFLLFFTYFLGILFMAVGIFILIGNVLKMFSSFQ